MIDTFFLIFSSANLNNLTVSKHCKKKQIQLLIKKEIMALITKISKIKIVKSDKLLVKIL